MLILFKQKKLIQKQNTQLPYPILPPQQTVNHIYDQHGIKLSLDYLLRNNPNHQYQALRTEFGRLTQSNDTGVGCTKAMNFINHLQIPSDKKVTYASFVCDYRPLKSEQWRVHLVVGGDKLTCPYDTGSPVAILSETKLILDSVISDSDKGAHFMILDLKDHFLASPMQTPKYMKIPQKYIPPYVINKYNLQSKIHHGVYVLRN